MKHLIGIAFILLLSHVEAFAGSCPLSSNESRLEYRYSSSSWLICDYRGGRLRSRFQHTDFESISVDYDSNGIPREYNIRSQNSGGGFYMENKKFNSSGMLVSHYLSSGNYGFECHYIGDYQLGCTSYENGQTYRASVEYVSTYDWN